MTESSPTRTCFFIAPMSEPGSETRGRSERTISAFQPVLEKYGYTIMYPWGLKHPGTITQEIAEHLVEDDLVLADITDGNANVFYELAVRHCLRRPCVQVMSGDAPIPFDVGQTKTIRIEDTIEGGRRAERELSETLDFIDQNPDKPHDNALARFIDIGMLFDATDADRDLGRVLSMLGEMSGEFRSGILNTQETVSRVAEQIRAFEKQHEEIRHDLAKGIVKTEDGIFRALKYDQRKGIVYYGNVAQADRRNILLNNETLKIMLGEIKAIARPNDQSADDPLYRIGFAASSRFAQHFEQHMQESHASDFDLYTWLDHWREYDSDAGFGAVEISRPQTEQSNYYRVDISIRNSFLTHNAMPNTREDDSLCLFMVGYIEGLLKSLSPDLYSSQGFDPDSIRVKHDWSDCFLKHRNSKRGCVFKVAVAALT